MAYRWDNYTKLLCFRMWMSGKSPLDICRDWPWPKNPPSVKDIKDFLNTDVAGGSSTGATIGWGGGPNREQGR